MCLFGKFPAAVDFLFLEILDVGLRICKTQNLFYFEASPTSWKLVRHVPQGATWHPASDSLKGVDEYGDENDPSQAFSKRWDTEEYTQVNDRYISKLLTNKISLCLHLAI